MNNYDNDSYKIEYYDFNITEDKIRKYPLENRENAKLLVVNKKGEIISDTIFKDIINFIEPETLIVFNDSKVLKTKVYGIREKNNKILELLIIKKLKSNLYFALVKNLKSFKEGEYIKLIKIKNHKTMEYDESDLIFEIQKREKDGLIISLNREINLEVLEEYGVIPIPPYFKRESERIDEIYYQNIFARKKGSVASPTAGLHFTDDLLFKLKEKQIEIAYITLHVGWGTFAPVRVEDIRHHNIHSEWYTISNDTANKINKAKLNNKKIIACGTTSLRALEGCYKDFGKITETEAETSIFIYPPFEFKVVDGMITNFHTPRSSLLILVSAFAGYENIKKYYNYALKNNYMFFSYGDAMFITP